jgi:hypothetical protein
MDHPYCYPGTNVYRNKEDICAADELEAFERQHAADRLLTLSHDLPITPAGYREIHRYILQDVTIGLGNTGRSTPGGPDLLQDRIYRPRIGQTIRLDQQRR